MWGATGMRAGTRFGHGLARLHDLQVASTSRRTGLDQERRESVTSWAARGAGRAPGWLLSASSGTPRAREVLAPGRRDVKGCSTAGVEEGLGTLDNPHRVVFLGTPKPAAVVLRNLMQKSADMRTRPDGHDGNHFEVSAVVSRPSKRRKHRRTLEGSPVASVAQAFGITDDALLAPESARDPEFLARMAEIKPTLCVTAAYGAVLPQNFLDIPTAGTVNIHPSALPELRGPAPVQRALMAGSRRLCVSLAFTVLKMDAGPVVSRQWKHIDPQLDADQATEDLFFVGSQLLLREMPSLLAGTTLARAEPQDDLLATQAPKVTGAEGDVDFAASSARQVHDRVCALASWPGTRAEFLLLNDPHKAPGDAPDKIVLKLSQTRVEPDLSAWPAGRPMVPGSVLSPQGKRGKEMIVVCQAEEGGEKPTLLRVAMVQPPSKKAMNVRDFFNGRKGATLQAVVSQTGLGDSDLTTDSRLTAV